MEKKVLSDSFSNVKLLFFNREHKAISSENLAVYEMSLRAFLMHRFSNSLFNSKDLIVLLVLWPVLEIHS